jgi:3-oxoacyl-[acyl-carrier-protein] synthase-3
MNPNAWRILAQLLEIDFERVYFPTLPEVGHVISADNIINLDHLVRSGRLQPGQKVLLCMAGYGLNWQAVILECA